MLGLLPYWNSAKGGETRPALSDERGLLMQQLGPKYYHLAKQGMVFTGNSAAGGSVLPIFSNTAQVFGIWNPAGSGVNACIINVRGTYVSTTGAAGGYVLAVCKNAGSAIATGGISVFTQGTPERGIVGSGLGGNKVLFTPSAATVIAPVILRQLGISQTVLTATDATNLWSAFKEDYDGDLVVAPNTAVFLAGNIATLCTIASSITWAEIPV